VVLFTILRAGFPE